LNKKLGWNKRIFVPPEGTHRLWSPLRLLFSAFLRLFILVLNMTAMRN